MKGSLTNYFNVEKRLFECKKYAVEQRKCIASSYDDVPGPEAMLDGIATGVEIGYDQAYQEIRSILALQLSIGVSPKDIAKCFNINLK